ncbi:MAG: ADP-ribosylglycohydrolase family protein [Elusimicrobiota bacterium]
MRRAEPPSLSRSEGCLLGLMAGDCLGLPREGLTPRRADRLFGDEIRHRLILGRGMASDDTELASFTAQSYLRSPDDPSGFERALAWKLRLWLLSLPAGIGLATLRSILKLWAGFPPSRSGIRSAGNGPVIRSPVLGVACWDDPAKLQKLVQASTRLTHIDPRTERGALAVAMAAQYAVTRHSGNFFVKDLLRHLAAVFPEDDAEARRWLEVLDHALEKGQSGDAFSRAMGFRRGVSGYVYQTVPAVLWAWLADPFDFSGGMRRVLSLGGDADTTGAIYGALAGASAGVEAIPADWLEGIVEFPRTVSWMRALARRLHSAAVEKRASEPLGLVWPLLAVRNPLFLAVVLAHGFRRLLPPY